MSSFWKHPYAPEGFRRTTQERKHARLSLCASLILVLAVSSTSIVARAQDTTTPPSPPAKDAAKEERLAEAKQQFEAGVALLDDPDGARYEQAYHAFKRAYELSQSPKVLGNIGFCAMKLERDGEAIDSYTQYLRDVPDVDEREKTQIQKDLLTLSSTVGRMDVTVKHDAKKFVLVDHRTQARGEPMENVYAFEGNQLSIRLRPGRHTMKITVNGTDDSLPYDVTIEPNGRAQHEFTFGRPRASVDEPVRGKKGSIVGPVILGAVGLAGIGTGVVFGILARNKESDIQSSCPNDRCPPTYELASNRTSAKTLGTGADISFISGGALFAGAVVWYLLVPSGSSDTQKTRGSNASSGSNASWLSSTSAMCTSDGCGVSLKRGF